MATFTSTHYVGSHGFSLCRGGFQTLPCRWAGTEACLYVISTGTGATSHMPDA